MKKNTKKDKHTHTPRRDEIKCALQNGLITEAAAVDFLQRYTYTLDEAKIFVKAWRYRKL